MKSIKVTPGQMPEEKLELNYNKKYLKGTNSTTKGFLKSIAYNVELRQLLKIKKTCAYNQRMPYTPIVVEIVNQKLKEHYGGNFLLQVFNRQGQSCFERVLEYDIACWNIFFDYFIFKLDPREKGKGWIYIVHLNLGFALVKVKDIFVEDPSYEYFGVNQDLLYYASKSEIKIIDIRMTLDFGEEVEFTPKAVQMCVYQINNPCRLISIFETLNSKNDQYLMCSIETEDNQIDTTRLYFWNRDLQQPDIEFFQYREVVAREEGTSGDHIVKFKQVIRVIKKEDGKEEDCAYAYAIRQSGLIDLYWNYTLTSSPEETFLDAEVTYVNFYLKRYFTDTDPDTGQPIQVIKQLVIPLNSEQRIGPDVAEIYNYKLEKWEARFYDLIRYYVKIFTKITLVTTNFFVAYNKVVSIYDIVKKEWKFHFFFKHPVIELLKNQKNLKTVDMNVGAYLENGDIKIIDTQDIHGENWKLTEKQFRVEGKLDTIVTDWRDISSHYILTRLPNHKVLFTGFQCSKMIDLGQVVSFTEDDELIRFISPDMLEDFVFLNRKLGFIRSFSNHMDGGQMTIVQSRNFYLKNPEVITGRLHAMVASHNKAHMLLFDDKNLYNLSLEDGVLTVREGMNVQSLQVLDVDYCYSLSNESFTQPEPGFYIQNVNAFLDINIQSANFKLKGAIVGINSLLDFYNDDQRIAYMSSYDTIKIVPVLHRCAIGFIGMKPRQKYLAFKKVKDKIIALDKKGFLTTWSIITGKILSHQRIPKGIKLNSFSIFQQSLDDISYKSQWCQPRVLLIDRENEVDIDENQYYGDRLKTSLQNNTPYIKIEKKTFLRHKVIEIMDSSSIIEHFTFVHPNYGYGEYQRIYFSDDLEYMLERLSNQRVCVYKKVDGGAPGEVKWELARRIKQFPMDLSECTYVNYLFSPNLMYYLDYDKDDNIFLIKNTLDQSTFLVIPQGLMNPSKERVDVIGKKFRWLDNSIIRIANQQGFEKTVDITKNFKQLSYCAIPNFNNKYLYDNPNSHFYYDISITSENETQARLRRKYQEYYSGINSDGYRDPEDLYEVLFRVDYNVDNCKGKLVADMSFTFFHWKLAEMMQSQAKFNIKRYHPDELKALALNIFPGGNTVLHYAYRQLYLVRRFYKVMEQEYQKAKETAEEADQVKKFEIPFIQNYERKTPIHLCLENSNFKSADIILSKLCNDPIDSHSRSIQDILPQIIQAELPSVGPYLDSRIIQTQQLKDFRRGAIKIIKGKGYGLGTVDLWSDNELIQKKFFTESKIDSEVVLLMIDVPAIHSYQEEVGDQFFEALANCKKIDIFTHKSIQAMIDYKWPLAKEFTIKALFIPFLLYLVAFIFYSNFFKTEIDKESDALMYYVDVGLAGVLYMFSIYFLQNEIRQIFDGPLDYLTSFWNYCDFVPPCFIITILSMHMKRNSMPTSKEDGFEQAGINRDNIFDKSALTSIHGLASLLMWFKLLYFLRIFEQTGYLVRMITEVINEMRVFLLMLTIVLIAFGESFLRFSEASDSDPYDAAGAAFISNYPDALVYAFRLSIGDINVDTFNQTIQPVVLWVIWALCLLLTNVVMLNLLIAIISESFNDINDNAIQANYQERARIIAENGYLIPKWKKKQFGGKNQYLVIAKEKTELEDKKDDPIQDMVAENAKTKKALLTAIQTLDQKLTELKKDLGVAQTAKK